MKDSYQLIDRKEREKFIFIDKDLKKLQEKALYIYCDLSFLCRSEGAIKEFEKRLDNEMREANKEKGIKIIEEVIKDKFERLDYYINNGNTLEAIEEMDNLKISVKEIIKCLRNVI